VKVPEFPVFTRSGEVTVALSVVREVVLSAVQLSRLYNFHHFIFRHVLRLEKLPMTFDPEHAETSNIVVPLSKGAVSLLVILLVFSIQFLVGRKNHWAQGFRLYSKSLLSKYWG